MARLPFNPDLIPTRSTPPHDTTTRGSTDARPLSVSDLARRIKDALAAGFPARVQVVGEVSNFSDRAHWFFSLKDEGATIRCVCFASSARKVPCPVRDGMQIIATGRLDFYDAQGHVQLYVDRIEPVGQGSLELQLRQLMTELREQGYFAPEHKKPLPMVPRRVAVVTSRSAAALQDVINTAARRWAGCRLHLYDVRVQGAQAAPEIARAIRLLSQHHERLRLDAIIVTRGGGSIEDLWAFNDRDVADAIYDCPLPVVAAIGHETDTTIAELVADLRCATPTQAVMQLIPDRAALEHQAHQVERRLSMLIHRQVEQGSHRLAAAARHTLFRHPYRLVEAACQRLDHSQRRLRTALPRRLEPANERVRVAATRMNTVLPRRLTPLRRQLEDNHARLAAALPRRVRPATDRLNTTATRLATLLPYRLREARRQIDALNRQLQAVNPANVLDRGYSYTLDEAGHVLKHAAHATPGTSITTVLADGRIRSTVDKTRHTPQAPPATGPSPRPRKSPHRQNDTKQPNLFG